MKLGSLKEGGRDGTLVVVSRDLSRAVRATGIAPTLQRALEDGSADGAFDVDMQAMAAPLPHRDYRERDQICEHREARRPAAVAVGHECRCHGR